jgi:uncharacterized protein (TIGR02246 family)
MRSSFRRRAATAPLCLVVLALWLAVVPPVAGAPPGPPPADAAAVQKVLDRFIEALNTADVKALAELFPPDATVFFPLAAMPLRLENKEQITAVFAAFFDGVRTRETGPRYMKLAPEDTRVQFLGDVAVVSFHLKGEQMISRRTLVLHKVEGTWFIVHLHASNVTIRN